MIDFLAKALLPVVAFLAGAFVQSYRTHYSETVAQLNELIAELQSARDAATVYWSKDEQDVEPSLSIEVRSALHLISALSAELEMPEGDHFTAELDYFFDAATGGSFETAERKSDLARALDLRLAAADLISSLRRRRRRINSWVFLFVEAYQGFAGWVGRTFTPYHVGRHVGRFARKIGLPTGKAGHESPPE